VRLPATVLPRIPRTRPIGDQYGKKPDGRSCTCLRQFIGSGDTVRVRVRSSRSTAPPSRAIGCRLATSHRSQNISRARAKRLEFPAGLNQSHTERWPPRHALRLFGGVLRGHLHHMTRPPVPGKGRRCFGPGCDRRRQQSVFRLPVPIGVSFQIVSRSKLM
jgi:hypothetical protein